MEETLQLDLSKAKGVLFSVSQASVTSNKLLDNATKLVEQLREQVRVLSNSSDKVLLNRAQDELEKGESLKAISTLVRLTSSQVESISRSLDDAKEGEYPLSPEENVVAQALREALIPSLSEVQVKLDPKQSLESQLIREINDIITNSTKLFAKVKSGRKDAITAMAKKQAQTEPEPDVVAHGHGVEQRANWKT